MKVETDRLKYSNGVNGNVGRWQKSLIVISDNFQSACVAASFRSIEQRDRGKDFSAHH
jgi:hypothetical protein